jgi:hypothetical protein
MWATHSKEKEMSENSSANSSKQIPVTAKVITDPDKDLRELSMAIELLLCTRPSGTGISALLTVISRVACEGYLEVNELRDELNQEQATALFKKLATKLSDEVYTFMVWGVTVEEHNADVEEKENSEG